MYMNMYILAVGSERIWRVNWRHSPLSVWPRAGCWSDSSLHKNETHWLLMLKMLFHCTNFVETLFTSWTEPSRPVNTKCCEQMKTQNSPTRLLTCCTDIHFHQSRYYFTQVPRLKDRTELKLKPGALFGERSGNVRVPKITNKNLNVFWKMKKEERRRKHKSDWEKKKRTERKTCIIIPEFFHNQISHDLGCQPIFWIQIYI